MNCYNTQYNPTETADLIKAEHSLDKITNDYAFFDALESSSIKLQNRVSGIAKVAEFNVTTSVDQLISAINYFKINEDLGNHPPCDFLLVLEKNMLYVSKKLRVSLYKILLFKNMSDEIKSGCLNLSYSYRYKAIQEYLIDEKIWQSQRKELLIKADLEDFADYSSTIDKLRQQLDSKYKITNDRFLNNENPFLSFNKKNKIKVSTPKVDSDDNKYISSLLVQAGCIPILQILADIDGVTNFTDCFEHSSIKHQKKHSSKVIIFAGVIAIGCNLGVERIVRTSIGINENSLKNTVTWLFTLKNIRKAINKTLKVTHSLPLANVYRYNPNELHTSSDGRKTGVAVDSILSSYSFKYFGKGEGVAIYTFIDERQLLFHSTVISSSDREAAYVIDGLLQNEVVKSSIHSTDTHGFTEIVSGTSYLLKVTFAPRIKNIGNRYIYSFRSRTTYEKLGYKILPSRTINQKSIEPQWDNILRFIATIKLRHSTASQLFKRLSSYAKTHPLYKALKEFGRINNSIYILTYLDDLELRQRIEKQLNKVESSNKFAKAIFIGNNQEFQHGGQDEQEIVAACNAFIQNTITLWNYLYISQLVANIADLDERKRMILAIKKSSMASWPQVNFLGAYDFTKHGTNSSSKKFDMSKILALIVN
jgi:TnpA family transposase